MIKSESIFNKYDISPVVSFCKKNMNSDAKHTTHAKHKAQGTRCKAQSINHKTAQQTQKTSSPSKEELKENL